MYIQAGTNHNDIGGFIIADNNETFIVDPGFSLYNAVTFSKERYSLDVLSSYGHSVPRICGMLQGPEFFGAVNTNPDAKAGEGSYEQVRFAGKIIETEFTDSFDRIVIDLKNAYDCASLKQLVREMVFDRKSREIIISDSFEFDSVQEFETAVITFCSAELVDSDSIVLKAKQSSMRLDYSGIDGSISFACVKDGYAGDHDVPVYPLRIARRSKAQKGIVSMKFRIL